MTDKEQIIIDGIDVSGCILRRRKEPNCTVCNGYSSKVFEFDCSDFKNCYFKQLARKTQECEEKERIIKNQRKEIRKHRRKLKELKNKLRTLDEETTTVEITEAEFAEYQSCKKQFEELIEVNNKRKEEIKTLKYMLYEERELCTETFKANFKIAELERRLSSNKNRFKYELNRYSKLLGEIEEVLKICDYQDCKNCTYKERPFCIALMKKDILNAIRKMKGTES